MDDGCLKIIKKSKKIKKSSKTFGRPKKTSEEEDERIIKIIE